MIKLSGWIIIDGYCATRVYEGTDSSKVENRVAFIEKSPRIRIAPFTNDSEDYKNWKYGAKGTKEYGMNQNSRNWCDQELLKLRYEL